MRRIKKDNPNTVEYWDHEWGRRPPMNSIIDRMRVVVPEMWGVQYYRKELAILDFGCGTGGHLFELADSLGELYRDKEIFFHGIDISRAAQLAFHKRKKMHFRENLRFIFWRQESPDPLPLKFDFIYSNHTFEHLEDPKLYIDYLLSHLNDIGILVIMVPYKDPVHDPEHIWDFEREDFPDAEFQTIKEGKWFHGVFTWRK